MPASWCQPALPTLAERPAKDYRAKSKKLEKKNKKLRETFTLMKGGWEGAKGLKVRLAEKDMVLPSTLASLRIL